MNKNKFEQYGETEFPEIYWQTKLEEYLHTSNFELLELVPKIISVEKDEIVFNMNELQNKYVIKKKSCKRHLPSINSDSILLTRHFIEIPFRGQKIRAEIYSEIESELGINEIVSKIIKNNPHWASKVLTEDQMKENIFHVLCYYFMEVKL